MTKLAVVQDQQDEIATEVLAREIVAISEGLKRLRAGRLNDRALVLLVQHATPAVRSKAISRAVVVAVLQGIEQLAATYTKKPMATA